MCRRIAGGIPGPVSEMTITAASACCVFFTAREFVAIAEPRRSSISIRPPSPSTRANWSRSRRAQRGDAPDRRWRRAANRRIAQVALPCTAARSDISSTSAATNAAKLASRAIHSRWAGKEHHVGDHLVRAKRLAVDRRQPPPALGITLVLQKRLSAGRDIRQRIVDLVAGSVGELFERVELRRLDRR